MVHDELENWFEHEMALKTQNQPQLDLPFVLVPFKQEQNAAIDGASISWFTLSLSWFVAKPKVKIHCHQCDGLPPYLPSCHCHCCYCCTY